MGSIESICISRKKGTVKKQIENAVIKENWGIEGDAHGGKWHRQISLLAGESIDKMREKIPQLSNGAFAENIITRGLPTSHIKVGEQLKIGKTIVLEITQIGKECHTGCAIRTLTGDCIMPREGLFAKVISGGEIKIGDNIELASDLVYE